MNDIPRPLIGSTRPLSPCRNISNSELGKWLLRDVFELPYGTKVTYDMLQIFGVDSVMFTKLDDLKYAIDFCNIGTYEAFYESADSDE